MYDLHSTGSALVQRSLEATTLKTGDRGEFHSRVNSTPDASDIRQRVQLSGRTVPPQRDPCHEYGMPLEMVDNATTRDLALALLRRKGIRLEILESIALYTH